VSSAARKKRLDLAIRNHLHFLFNELHAFPSKVRLQLFLTRRSSPENFGLVMLQQKVETINQGVSLIHKGALALEGP
jgi:hypothetical protein